MNARFRDRISGGDVRPGKIPLIGRWKLDVVDEEATFLNSSRIHRGDFLVPDARGQWGIVDPLGEHLSGTFGLRQILDELEAASVRTIGQRLDELTDARSGWIEWLGVSPLVPGMSERVELQRLERCMREHVGHLEEVCRRPRAHLRVEEERAPVSRARRIPNRAANYLAAHTEDWERPTLRAVLPKRILSLVRDDQLDIYENRVAARLVDHLISYLNRRISELRRLLRIFDEAGDHAASAAGGSHWRQARLYRLWGAAIDANEGRKKAERTLKEVEWLKYKLSGLMDSMLYQEVPRRASIGSTLRMTNILANDPHYRHVAVLWQEWARLGVGLARSPRDIYEGHQSLCRGFASFSVLLVARALEQLGVDPIDLGASLNRGCSIVLLGSSRRLTLSWTGDDSIVVEDEGGTSVRFVPMPAFLPGLPEDQLRRCVEEIEALATTREIAVVLYPAPSSHEEIAQLDSSLQLRLCALKRELHADERDHRGGPSLLPVSPWDLGSVERVARALRWVTTAPRFLDYPHRVPSPGPDVFDLRRAGGWLCHREGELVITRPPLEHEIAELATQDAILRLTAHVEETEAEHEGVSEVLRLAVRRGDATGALNTKKKALNTEVKISRDALSRAQAFATAIERAIPRARDLLGCPMCLQEADARRHFEAGGDRRFTCRCGDCSTKWGTLACGSCGDWFPILIPGSVDLVASGEHWGWVDRVFGGDVLAIPCRRDRSGEAFICPSCGVCPCPACRSPPMDTASTAKRIDD